MARFRATIHGSRGLASRVGNAKSGIIANVNGWDSGIRVVATTDCRNWDTFLVYQTGGSKGHSSTRLVGILTAKDNGVATWEPHHTTPIPGGSNA